MNTALDQTAARIANSVYLAWLAWLKRFTAPVNTITQTLHQRESKVIKEIRDQVDHIKKQVAAI